MSSADPTAVLLAGGRSERFGRDKPTLHVGHETLVERHVRQARVAGVRRFVVVANKRNQPALTAIAKRAGIGAGAVCLQEGDKAEHAVLTGLRHCDSAATVFVICTNDVVDDDAYVRVSERALAGDCVVVAGAQVDWPFVGGMLITGPGDTLVRIEERRAEPCPPGVTVNIMIHRHAGAGVLSRLRAALAAGEPYETSVGNLVAAGTPGLVARLPAWVGIKRREDLDRVMARFGLGVGRDV